MAYQHFPVLVTSSAIANLFAFFAENISFVDKSKISQKTQKYCAILADAATIVT